jgi:hypothetical protein
VIALMLGTLSDSAVTSRTDRNKRFSRESVPATLRQLAQLNAIERIERQRNRQCISGSTWAYIGNNVSRSTAMSFCGQVLSRRCLSESTVLRRGPAAAAATMNDGVGMRARLQWLGAEQYPGLAAFGYYFLMTRKGVGRL